MDSELIHVYRKYLNALTISVLHVLIKNLKS